MPLGDDGFSARFGRVDDRSGVTRRLGLPAADWGRTAARPHWRAPTVPARPVRYCDEARPTAAAVMRRTGQ